MLLRMDERWAELLTAAGQSAGLVTLRQAEDVGVSRQALAHHVASRGWHRVAPGVYLAPGFALTPRVRAMAVDLSVTRLEPDRSLLGALSHRTAAAFYGLLHSVRLPIDYTAHVNCSKRPPKSRIRRARWLDRSMITNVDGAHVLIPPAMFLTLASCCHFSELVHLLQKAHQLRVCTPQEASNWLEHAPLVPQRHRLVLALEKVREELTHSNAEALARKHLRDAGFRPAPAPLTVEDERGPIAEVDIPLTAEKVAIVVDGPHHDSPDQRRFDDDQRLRLQMQGWLVLRADLYRLRYQHQAFLSQVRAAVANRQVGS